MEFNVLLRDQKKDDCLYVNLMDEEGDSFQVYFEFDETAKIICDNINHLHLSSNMLNDIERFLWTAEAIYKKETEQSLV